MLPSYELWKTSTSLGTFKPRSSLLRAVDEHIRAYHAAASDYGRGWEAREAKLALDEWKRSKGKDWKSSGRNEKGAIEQLDAVLTRLVPPMIGRSRSESHMAEQLRKGALYFMANARTRKMPSKPEELVNDATDLASDIQGLIRTGEAPAREWRVASGKFYKGDEGNGFLDTLHEKLKDYLWSLVEVFGLDDAARAAGQWVESQLSEVMLKVLGGLLSELGTAIAVTKNLVAAGKAAWTTWKTRHLADGILAGHPRTIVMSVREQIRNAGYGNLKEAAKSALVAGVGMANPVVGSIVGAIASLYGFVTSLFDRYRELSKLTKLFQRAPLHYRGELYRLPDVFNAWFLKVIKDLPIISSYCMTMPMTGSYYGFLSLVATDGHELGYRQLERNYGMFNDVKKYAVQFVQDHPIRIESDDALVKHSLQVARNQQSAWDSMKSGIKSRLQSIGVGVIEAAPG